MKSLLKELFFNVANPFGRSMKGCASILMYHSIGENDAFFTVKPDEFEKQMNLLKQSGKTVVKLSELVRRLRAHEDISNLVVITFDDGYEDNFVHAYPILRDMNFPFTVFIVTDFIGLEMTNSEGVSISIMNAQHLRELAASGIAELMPHTGSHVPLTKYTDDSWKADIEKSRSILVHEYDSSGGIFAYPQGKFMRAAVEYLQGNGYSAAVTVREGLVNPNDPLFELKRNSIDSTTTRAQFIGKISRTTSWYTAWKS